MNALPKNIDRRVARAVSALTVPFEIISKRNHYFVQVAGHRVCIGSNSSSEKGFLVRRCLDKLNKLNT